MNFISRPVVILISVAIAAVVGAFGYNYKHKASVSSEYLDGFFGSYTRAAMEKSNTNGNICIVAALFFLGLAIAGIVVYAKRKKVVDEGDKH